MWVTQTINRECSLLAEAVQKLENGSLKSFLSPAILWIRLDWFAWVSLPDKQPINAISLGV